MTDKPFVSNNTGNQEWYTPPSIVERARAVMGNIDLDPASCSEANQTVKADRYFTVADNGLSHPWRGNVFINPPYTSGLIARFVEKLMLERICGNTLQAILITNNCTETKWFQKLVKSEPVVLCFIQGRVKFMRPGGIGGAPLQGQTLYYLGHKQQEFANRFADMGWCCRHIPQTEMVMVA